MHDISGVLPPRGRPRYDPDPDHLQGSDPWSPSSEGSNTPLPYIPSRGRVLGKVSEGVNCGI